MKLEKTSGLTSLKCAGALSWAATLLIAPDYVYARTLLPGEVATVSGPVVPEAWTVPGTAVLNLDATQTLNISLNGGTLNAAAAVTAPIEASSEAQVNLSRSTVTSSGFDTAVSLIDSTATITGSTLTSQGTALALARDLSAPGGSTATVTDSTLQGGIYGAAVTSLSTLNLINSRAIATDPQGVGLTLLGGTANVSADSRVVGDLNGVMFEQDTPAALAGQGRLTVDGSTIQGLTGAAISVNFASPADQPVLIDVRNGSSLIGGNGNILEVIDGGAVRFQVDNSQLTGNIDVANGGSASVLLQNTASLAGSLFNVNSVVLDTRSTLTGNVQGTGENASVELKNASNLNGNVVNAGTVMLDTRSTLTGNIQGTGENASVVLKNASNLNGNLANVDSVTLDTQSVMIGNIQSSGAGVVALDNHAIFTGAVTGVREMALNRGAQWNMVGNNTLGSLTMQGDSAVRLGTNEAFGRLDVANLSGNGRFLMGTDLATGNTDFLNVTQSATGQHQLVVAATASEPVSGVPVKVGNIASGDAQFSLKNGQVDVGALAYKLVKEGEGLYLQPDATTPSTGSKTAMAIAGTAPTVIYSEMTTLNTRLGDRRMAGTQPQARSAGTLDNDGEGGAYGIWIRTYGNQYNVKSAYGDGYKQNQTGVSLGADTPLPFGDGQWLIGVFGGYSTTNLNLSRGSSGSIDSVYLGTYLTWFDQATGYYVDTVAKVNRFNNDVKVTLSDDTRTKGDFNNLGLSGSFEAGKHIAMSKGYFIEPSVQVGVAAVQGKNYSLDNGLQVNNDQTRSLLGKAGMTVGREVTLDNGSKLQPRLRAAVSHEFVNNNRVSVNETDFNNDLSSTSLELTGGVNWIPVNNKWQVYAEVSTSQGSKIDQELGGSVGLSYNF
ncbi:autotransporter outer membrane beta-barrel domain-containing protein [Pseudomonas sp. H1h]|uniref:autotransporter outer membrane beta-barrel domain-containing protein n=1 Tax=Pseudomonas sp. H1h TaxID=1397280 RepID=UPI0004698C4B|nr:autotransporter outer membrane beta-barrel domain-containing protein [Pseudomonas sp. H1h]